MRILAIPGALRKGSYNRKLLKIAVELLKKRDVEVEEIDLKDFPLPLYDGDIQEEKGLPDECWKLQAKIAASHCVIVACPEYNWGVPGTFKNMVDWTSRGDTKCWKGKVIGMMGASNGAWGTQRMMPMLRQSFSSLSAFVHPHQVNVANSPKVWDENGKLLDEKLTGQVEKFLDAVLHTTKLIHVESLKSES